MTDRDASSVRRFPAPWQVEQIPGGFKVLDAGGFDEGQVIPRKREPVFCGG
jgi:hypothetical protein